jgi:outer membrane receptor protein involved in Fe transport
LRLLQDDDPDNDLTPSEAQREFIWKHRRTGFIVDPDYTLDFGFGGPVPLLYNWGHSRFYLSHQNSTNSFVVPLSREAYRATTTRLKVNADVSKNIKLTLTAQYSVDQSVSPYSWTTTPTGSVLSSVYSVANLVSGGSNVLFKPGYYSPSDIYKSNFGIKLNHMLDQHSFYELVYQYLHSKYWTFETETRDTTLIEIMDGIWRDEAPYGYNADEWMNLGRDSSLIQSHSLKFDYTNQFNDRNQYKMGVLFKYTDLAVRSYTESNKDTWTREQIYDQQPFSLAAYIQDKLEYEGFIANIGVRVEYNNPNSPVYMLDIYDPMYGQGFGSSLEAEAPQEDAKAFWKISPRLGISHPITNRSKLYFNYGHFHSTPASSYRYRLQREYNGQVTSIGNPNLGLEQTVAYELGYSHGIMEDYLLNIATYYKDVTDQAGWVRYTSFDGAVNYIKPENNNYADIRGIEFTLSKLNGTWFSGFVNYTYMVKTSGYFGLRQYYENQVEQQNYNEINPTDFRSVPTPYARMNLVFRTPQSFGPELGGFGPLRDWNLSFLATYHTGSTWDWTENNKQVHRPWVNTYNVNARLSRTFATDMGNLEFFLDISNLLNTKWLSYTGFAGSRDWTAYRNSLRLPWEEGIDRGDDHLGDYRDWDTEYRQFVTVDSLSGVQGTPRSYEIYWDKTADSYHSWNDETGDWDLMSQSEIDQIVADKAYIDMPNIRSMSFLNPRQITFGIRLKF